MTAEIAVLNKSAVALAADSKVTISGGTGRKTFDTVNKVFTLSKVHPVGVMIFGSAEFMRYPWETIIKLYRSAKGSDEEDTIQAWGDDFVKYVKTFGDIHQKSKTYNLTMVLTSFLQSVEQDALKNASRSSIQSGTPDYLKVLLSVIETSLANLTKAADFMEGDTLNKFAKDYGECIRSCVRRFTKGRESTLRKATFKLLVVFVAKFEFSPSVSGVVIAGFGRKELFPTLINYKTDGFIGDDIKILQGETLDVSRTMSAAVAPFAQREMVDRFMEGIDPTYSSVLDGAFENALVDSCLTVLEKYGSSEQKTNRIRAEVTKAAKRRAKALSVSAKAFREDRFVAPVVTMVSLLPLDELANLAESLVALTSLRRRVSSNVETVGGPIDVAVITKSDGFIWLKRKHYFKPELNPNFNDLYLRGALKSASMMIQSGLSSEDDDNGKDGEEGGL